jgi:hypothetical protein
MTDFTYNQKHCWVMGRLLVKKAHSKETAIPIPKTYLKAAKELVVNDPNVHKNGDKFFWINS